MMRFQQFFTTLCMAAALLATGSCGKDSDIPHGAILLATEGYEAGGGAKTSVAEASVQWVTGDVVVLDGRECTVTVNGRTAYVTGFQMPETGCRGYYPAGILERFDTPEAQPALPAEYASSYTGGRQVLDLPMVAAAPAGATTVVFKHLTAAVRVLVRNETDYPLCVDRVVVESPDRQLCGLCSAAFSGAPGGASTLTVTPAVTGSVPLADRRVTVSIADAPALAPGGVQEVQVPVLPVEAGQLAVRVYTHVVGAPKGAGYLFDRSLPAPGIGRNVMMTARVVIGGQSTPAGGFTVGAGRRVLFAQGNLQYQAGTDTWRFASRQYDAVGNAPGNTTAANRAAQTDWIDLFGWGTSGADGKYPWLASTEAADYVGGTQDIAATDYDWGRRNAISNGGGRAGQWRTLTSAEWDYLLNSRTATASGLPEGYGGSHARFTKARVGSVNGMILFPDRYSHPEGVEVLSESYFDSYNNALAGYNDFEVTGGWELMEEAGAVFLPAAGYRWGTTVSDVFSQGAYWSASRSGGSQACRLYFVGTPDDPVACYNGQSRAVGSAVRLVMDL